jgi:hypothetical protein
LDGLDRLRGGVRVGLRTGNRGHHECLPSWQ